MDYATPTGSGQWEVRLDDRTAGGTFGAVADIEQRIADLQRRLRRAQAVEAAQARLDAGPVLGESVIVWPGDLEQHVGRVTKIDGSRVLVEGAGAGGSWHRWLSTCAVPSPTTA